MSNIGSTGCPVNDATLIVSKNLAISIDADGNWAPVECCLELLLVLWSNLPVVEDLYPAIRGAELASGLLLDLVWVVLLLHHRVNAGVGEGIIDKTTIATEVAPSSVGCTVDKLLRSQPH